MKLSTCIMALVALAGICNARVFQSDATVDAKIARCVDEHHKKKGDDDECRYIVVEIVSSDSYFWGCSDMMKDCIKYDEHIDRYVWDVSEICTIMDDDFSYCEKNFSCDNDNKDLFEEVRACLNEASPPPLPPTPPPPPSPPPPSPPPPSPPPPPPSPPPADICIHKYTSGPTKKCVKILFPGPERVFEECLTVWTMCENMCENRCRNICDNCISDKECEEIWNLKRECEAIQNCKANHDFLQNVYDCLNQPN
jgi:hypothetical protein